MSAGGGVPRRVRMARGIGFAAWGALGLLMVLWHGILPPTGSARLPALVLALLPLALPLLSLRQPSRALLLAGMLALFYFSHGVVEAWSGTAPHGLAWIEIVLSLTLIGAIGASMQKRPRRG